MDCNIKTEDKKVVMKLLNQYADSYQCLEKQNKVLQESIKDLKTNLKINKDIISNFLSKSTSTEINKSIIAKLNSQVESLTKSNEDLTKQNLSLIQSQNAISQELSILNFVFNNLSSNCSTNSAASLSDNVQINSYKSIYVIPSNITVSFPTVTVIPSDASTTWFKLNIYISPMYK